MTNPSANSYPISEIFDSIQGEGSWLGLPVTFIRFSGCNLRCDWCDTKYSWDVTEKQSMESILTQIHQKRVVLTGGEPTIYSLTTLIQALKNQKYIISIETNGTNPIHDPIDWIVCSPKPSAKYQIMCKPHELKYVVDTDFDVSIIPQEYIGKIPIWLQPNSANMEKSMKKCYELVMRYDYLRLGIQLHKIYKVR